MFSIQNIQFREILDTDLEMILKWRNNKNVRSMMKDDHLISQDEHEIWFSLIKKNSTCDWFIVQYHEKDVGVLGVTDIDNRYNTCTWSMYLSESMMNRGIGVLLEICAIDLMFNSYKIKKIWGELLSINRRLLTLHKKCGFDVDKINKNKYKRDGKSVDLIKISMQSSGWDERKEEIVKQYNLS